MKTPNYISLDFLPKQRISPFILRAIGLLEKLIWGIGIFFFIYWVVLLLITSGYSVKAKLTERKAAAVDRLETALEIKSYNETTLKNITFLESIASHRSSWGAKSGILTKEVPRGVWLNNISIVTSEDGDAEILIEGAADDNKKIINFLKNIENVSWLKNVRLVYSRTDYRDGARYNYFEIICNSET